MGVSGYKGLLRHVGHKVACVTYQLPEDKGIMEPDNVAIECETCNEVLFDFDNPRAMDYPALVKRSRMKADRRRKVWYIRGSKSCDVWSNELGWLDLVDVYNGIKEANFSLFTNEEKEKYNLPVDGEWATF